MSPLTLGKLPTLGELVVFLFGLALLAWLVVLVVALGCVTAPELAVYLPCRCEGGIRLSRTEAARGCSDGLPAVCDPMPATSPTPGPRVVSLFTPEERRLLFPPHACCQRTTCREGEPYCTGDLVCHPCDDPCPLVYIRADGGTVCNLGPRAP